ncbi:exosortase-associated EpsI family protein [Botrimarina mediterranea]|uniref:Methanolan biosynthesis EpsI domain-containing protein n=1 Tax=Botrimarina mediterranea TaxID=2528022 RepID=A0A518K3J3_9BACT|nr:exosortase-associated EpsI family protein [Botrimarina mediterranea]QDV72372.1 hypothetical protein Spa11_05460 [Botrimarina mediterranea]QDV76918.1 hypothetical protein K2D_05010 [Planctomycetes bacterium K2D]
MTRVIPIVIAILAIVSLTVVEGVMSERWADSRHCGYCASLLDNVPTKIGQWESTDNKVTEVERKGAGARGYVSRTYHSNAKGKDVGVWFIVGHARDTFRHTPDICYGSNGFEMQSDQTRYELPLEDGKQASFFTATFAKPDAMSSGMKQRVFWTWFKPDANSGEPVVWRVPDGMTASALRYEFAAAPALYKLYFTVSGADAEAAGDESVAMEFAREFLASVEPVIAPANGKIPDGFTPKEENL